MFQEDDVAIHGSGLVALCCLKQYLGSPTSNTDHYGNKIRHQKVETQF